MVVQNLCTEVRHGIGQQLPVEPATLHRAAILTLDAQSGLRAGDALHVAAGLDARAASMATLDGVLAKNAACLKRKLVRL